MASFDLDTVGAPPRSSIVDTRPAQHGGGTAFERPTGASSTPSAGPFPVEQCPPADAGARCCLGTSWLPDADTAYARHRSCRIQPTGGRNRRTSEHRSRPFTSGDLVKESAARRAA